MDRIKIILILTLITLLSVIYVYWGDNWLDDLSFRVKERNNQFVRNDLMQKLLELENQSYSILDEMTQLRYELEIFPEKDLKLSILSEIDLENKITLQPEIGSKYLFIVMKNRLQVFDKDNFNPIWNKELSENIIFSKLIDGNRYLIQTENYSLLCYNRVDGNLIWQKDFSSYLEKNNKLLEIRLDKYKKLDSSIIVLIEKNVIILIDTITGHEIFKLEKEENIDFISDFDPLLPGFYLVSGNKISKIKIEDR